MPLTASAGARRKAAAGGVNRQRFGAGGASGVAYGAYVTAEQSASMTGSLYTAPQNYNGKVNRYWSDTSTTVPTGWSSAASVPAYGSTNAEFYAYWYNVQNNGTVDNNASLRQFQPEDQRPGGRHVHAGIAVGDTSVSNSGHATIPATTNIKWGLDQLEWVFLFQDATTGGFKRDGSLGSIANGNQLTHTTNFFLGDCLAALCALRNSAYAATYATRINALVDKCEQVVNWLLGLNDTGGTGGFNNSGNGLRAAGDSQDGGFTHRFINNCAVYAMMAYLKPSGSQRAAWIQAAKDYWTNFARDRRDSVRGYYPEEWGPDANYGPTQVLNLVWFWWWGVRGWGDATLTSEVTAGLAAVGAWSLSTLRTEAAKLGYVNACFDSRVNPGFGGEVSGGTPKDFDYVVLALALKRWNNLANSANASADTRLSAMYTAQTWVNLSPANIDGQPVPVLDFVADVGTYTGPAVAGTLTEVTKALDSTRGSDKGAFDTWSNLAPAYASTAATNTSTNLGGTRTGGQFHASQATGIRMPHVFINYFGTYSPLATQSTMGGHISSVKFASGTAGQEDFLQLASFAANATYGLAGGDYSHALVYVIETPPSLSNQCVFSVNVAATTNDQQYFGYSASALVRTIRKNHAGTTATLTGGTIAVSTRYVVAQLYTAGGTLDAWAWGGTNSGQIITSGALTTAGDQTLTGCDTATIGALGRATPVDFGNFHLGALAFWSRGSQVTSTQLLAVAAAYRSAFNI